jgi:hypothetical protein
MPSKNPAAGGAGEVTGAAGAGYEGPAGASVLVAAVAGRERIWASVVVAMTPLSSAQLSGGSGADAGSTSTLP